MGRREATLVVQEDFAEKATSELSSEHLVGAREPQGLSTKGRGDENKNPTLLLSCRKNGKAIFSGERIKRDPEGPVCVCYNSYL